MPVLGWGSKTKRSIEKSVVFMRFYVFYELLFHMLSMSKEDDSLVLRCFSNCIVLLDDEDVVSFSLEFQNAL